MTIAQQLNAITASATGPHGIEVTVNLEGKLIALTLGTAQRHMTATQLAAEIHTLTRTAATTALSQGMTVLAPYTDLLD
ncbi:hypothetical protein [Actinokineospora terrae]|uniref:YbaB/EbfC DNA-binding family protein n=1 Tax=Actinokineospora terrae TaxID=155974 RepID=A0A1H9NNY0_9PSEU|nr:hypothetical protein [Actinokineospora terrae]SER37656.1 hypothetical protein SAMN04487818_10358 [Actinokineospora terrae]